MTSRVCADIDCRKWARPNGWFCSDACRARTWKRNHPGYDPRQGRENAGERGSRVSNRGGLQVSVGRMLESLMGPPAYLTEWAARAHVAQALSERQRTRFEGPGSTVVPGQLEMEAA